MNARVKKLSVVVGATAVLTVGGIAFGFWTAGGDGEAEASTADAAAVVVRQTSQVTELRPGGDPQSLSGTFDNPNEGPVQVTRVQATIEGVQKAAGATGACDASDYTLTGADMPVGREVPAGTSQGSWSGATLAFHNKPDVNQDGCKGATVTVAYVAY